MSTLRLRAPIEKQPILTNHWFLRFPTELNIDSFDVASVSSPKLNADIVDIPFFSTSTYLYGRYEFDTITVTVREHANESAQQKLMNWVNLGIEVTTGRVNYAIAYKKDLAIELCDPLGLPLRRWELSGAFVQTFEPFQELSYSDASVSMVSMTLKFDTAILKY